MIRHLIFQIDKDDSLWWGKTKTDTSIPIPIPIPIYRLISNRYRYWCWRLYRFQIPIPIPNRYYTDIIQILTDINLISILTDTYTDILFIPNRYRILSYLTDTGIGIGIADVNPYWSNSSKLTVGKQQNLHDIFAKFEYLPHWPYGRSRCCALALVYHML